MKTILVLPKSDLLILFLLLIPMYVISRDAPITSVGTATVCPGASVTLPLTVKNFTNVSGISLRLDYNPQLMAFSSYSNINPALSGLLINDNIVSDTLHKIMISWTSVSPVSLINEDTLLNLDFTFLSGNATLEFNNTSNGGQDCEYADENADPMNDTPANNFYRNGNITNKSPGSPVSISGPANVRQCSEGILYSVDPVAGASSYLWTLPGGATGTSSTNSIVINFGPTAVSGNISVKGLNDCGYGKESSLNITLNSPVIQSIYLTTGWNIFSTNLIPCYPDLKALSQTLITNGFLVKIQDETGNSLEDLGVFGGWTNNIGNVSLDKGYKIKVTRDCQLEVSGIPAILPDKMPLKTGWNIIGFPRQSEAEGIAVVQELIIRGTLIKVQDENGNSIEDYGVFGGWQNNIGNFIPGKGYKVKVNATDTLTIYESYLKSSSSQVSQVFQAQAEHFKPVTPGNGTDHMNINLVNIPAEFLSEGDEIGVFDGNICVGAMLPVTGDWQLAEENMQPANNSQQQKAKCQQPFIVSIPVSSKDEYGSPGFTEGNPFTLKIRKVKTDKEYLVIPEIIRGPSTFKKHESAFVSMAKSGIKRLDNNADKSLHEVKCYPNPFNDEITIEIRLVKDSRLRVDVLDELGQEIRALLLPVKLVNGWHSFSWDGTNDNRSGVSHGIYYLRIVAEDEVILRKVILSK